MRCGHEFDEASNHDAVCATNGITVFARIVWSFFARTAGTNAVMMTAVTTNSVFASSVRKRLWIGTGEFGQDAMGLFCVGYLNASVGVKINVWPVHATGLFLCLIAAFFEFGTM